ncbi:MAG: pyridoxal phosphate-dependent aminotransferase [Verrucomicrobiota bacterium]|nr:pyridoxal phosphate-dependent aminotransferase [Verrucomicrobiota bacterium]
MNDRTTRSPYMEWAKTRSQARFNLATSGIANVTMREFPPLRLDQLEITHGGYGYAPLLERIAQHHHARPDCVVTCAGTSMANHLAMAALLAPGDGVLIEEPAYGPLVELAEYLGARVRRTTRRFENDFALELEEISPATRLIVLTNLHNPSGALLSAETLRAIGEKAQRVGARVLVDEVYLEMLFDPDAPFAWRIGESLGGENPFVVTNSLTKLYGLSGLRCGWIIAAPELARRIWLLNDLFAATAPHVPELMSVIAFDQLEQLRERARKILTTNRPLIDAFLDSRKDLECFRPRGGTVFFPRLTSGSMDEFLQLLRDKYETTVVPGSFFEMPRHFRLGIGGETQDLRAGLERLADALDEFA